MAEEMTLGQKIRSLSTEALECANKKDADGLKAVRAKLAGLKELVGKEIVKFDKIMDQVETGSFGKGFASDVERFRAKSEKVGRPKVVKADPLAAFDL